MKKNKKNIIITGGAGFIGSHLVCTFVKKYPEYNIINMLSASKAKKLRTYIKQTQCSSSYECAALCNVGYHRRDWPGVLLRTIRFY